MNIFIELPRVDTDTKHITNISTVDYIYCKDNIICFQYGKQYVYATFNNNMEAVHFYNKVQQLIITDI